MAVKASSQHGWLSLKYLLANGVAYRRRKWRQRIEEIGGLENSIARRKRK